MMAGLERAVRAESPESTLVIVGLDGLEEHLYRRGRLEAELLLVELAARFHAVFAPVADCYRAREDEFVALAQAPGESLQGLLDAVGVELRVQRGSVAITPKIGVTLLPDEASDPIEALMLADEQLYAEASARKARERRLGPPRETSG